MADEGTTDQIIEVAVLVVGGGPAGSAAAWELTRRGMDCMVLDRERFPREKLCAGWITPEVLRDLEFEPADYPHRFLTFDTLNVSAKGLRVPFRSPQHSIRRFEFDAWMLQRSGARVLQHNVRHIVDDGAGFLVDDRFRCEYLIGAGGSRCPVYRNLFRARQPRNRSLQVVTQELEFPHACADADCHLWFFNHRLPGYSWFVPKADGYVNVGVGALAGQLQRRGNTIRWHWQRLLEDLGAADLLAETPGEPGGYSYFLRSRQVQGRLGNAFITGDAAGLATRDMCEGIGPAVRSGLMAARSILCNQAFDLDTLGAHTLGHPVARRLLDFSLTGLGSRWKRADSARTHVK